MAATAPSLISSSPIPETSPLRAIYADWEQRFRTALVAEWQRKVRDLAEKLAKRYDKANLADPIPVQPSFWDDWQDGYLQLVTGYIEEAAGIGVKDTVDDLDKAYSLGIDMTLANTEATKWAETYSAQLVKGLVSTDKDAIRKQLGIWTQSKETFPDLVARIAKAIGDPGRAEVIAATEATRSYAAGNVIGWQTAGILDKGNVNDALAKSPPAHVSCRCWITRDPFTGLVWNTANDERVCPICLPLADKVVLPISRR